MPDCSVSAMKVGRHYRARLAEPWGRRLSSADSIREGRVRAGSDREGDPVSEPLRQPRFVDLVCSHGEHRFDGIVGVGPFVVPGSVVEIDEQDKAGPRCSLVAVGERMVPGDPTGQHGGFVVRVGIEVGVVEAGLWCMESGVGEVDAAGLISVAASMPVTCSARYQNSARLR